MTAAVHFLNVGWGDAHAIISPEGKLTFIDGGDGLPSGESDSPLDWMNRSGHEEMEWMIATHVHLDHIGGFLEIARSKRVHKAILPYPEYSVPALEDLTEQQRSLWAETRDVTTAFGCTYDLLLIYVELIHALEGQGTQILYREQFSGKDNQTVWSEAGIRLRQVFPWPGDSLPAFGTLNHALEVLRSGADDWEEAMALYFAHANPDSSIYVLDYKPEQPADSPADGLRVVFGADQEVDTWLHVLGSDRGLPHGPGTVWKIPHHGMPDALSVVSLSAMNPDVCVIPISIEGSLDFHAHWTSIREDWQQAWHLTGDLPKGKGRIIAEDGRITVWVGSA